MPFFSGLGIGMLALLIPGIILFYLGWGNSLEVVTAVGIGLLVTALFAGIMLAFLTWYERHQYITHIDDFRGLTSPKILLKVINGKVVEWGKFVWGKEGVCPVKLPSVRHGEFSVSTRLEYMIDTDLVSVPVELTAYISEKAVTSEATEDGFIPQELFNHVVLPGYQSVGAWLAGTFKWVAERNSALKRALSTPSSKGSYIFGQKVRQALRGLPFANKLSNITRIIAIATVNDDAIGAVYDYSG